MTIGRQPITNKQLIERLYNFRGKLQGRKGVGYIVPLRRWQPVTRSRFKDSTTLQTHLRNRRQDKRDAEQDGNLERPS